MNRAADQRALVVADPDARRRPRVVLAERLVAGHSASGKFNSSGEYLRAKPQLEGIRWQADMASNVVGSLCPGTMPDDLILSRVNCRLVD